MIRGKFGVGPLVNVSLSIDDKLEELTCEYLGLTFETELIGVKYMQQQRVAVLTEEGDILTVKTYEVKFLEPAIQKRPDYWGPR